MPADSGNTPTGATVQPTPVSGRAALVVLGSMIFLIIALTILLVQSTWVHPANAAESPPALEHSELGSR
ncbi:MAG TPA: hypothetical protein VIG08_06920 [Gemmatimonadales bacterium]